MRATVRSSRRVRTVVVSISAAAGLLAAGDHAQAFNLKTHIAIANQALGSIADGAAGAVVTIPTFGELEIHNDEVVNALLNHHEYYRAGVLGPDVFPDLVGGQLTVHVNKGCEKEGPGCMASSVRMEERTFKQWRSIDYGMYQLRRALDYRRNELTGDALVAREQAIAFAYGYLAHMIGDGFAHSYVNEWVRGVFNIFEGRAGALFGPPTEELQHKAVEGYLDAHVFVPLTDLEIAWPTEFLAAMYTQPVTGPEVESAPAGAFGGVYFEKLIDFRNVMATLSNSQNWLGFLPAPGDELAARLIQLRNLHANVLTLGTGVGDPVRDIEDYFLRRKNMADALLNRWADLSGCVGGNILKGSAVPAGEILQVDRCRSINFESDPAVADIFDGTLNEAAWFGMDENPAKHDFGTLGNNFKKILKFLGVVAQKAIVFNITEDIRSIRIIKDEILRCNGSILGWDSCDQACNAAHQFCTDFVGGACDACPDFCKESLGGMAACVAAAGFLNPFLLVCLDCDAVTNAACTQVVAGAAPICAFCGQNPICTAVDAIDEIQNLQQRLIAEVLRPILTELKQRAIDTLLEHYGGPYAKNFVELFALLESNASAAKPAWKVNLTFLQEDLRSDPAYLERILQNLLGTGGALVSNLPVLAEAVAQTVLQTGEAGGRVLRLYIDAQSGALEARVWEGLVTILMRIAREQSFDAVTELANNNPVYDWLDGFNFKSSQQQYDTRLAKFIALVEQLNLLGAIRGPTATMLHQDYRLPADPPGGLSPANLYEVHPAHNAIQLTKLSYLGGPGVDGLVSGTADAQVPGLNRSLICSTTPNILCDSIQSLDDPNNWGPTTLANNTADWERSVAYWVTRDWKWEQGRVFQDACVLSPTDFVLAESRPRADRLYSKIFTYPSTCVAPRFAGFDDSSRPWTAGGGTTLTPNTGNKTEGTASTQVNGCGWIPLLSPTFSTTEFGTVGSEVSFDIFIPLAQSNPYWVGDAQMTFSAPAANLYNAYLGWRGLTNLTRGAWNTLTFTLPPAVQAALLADHPGAQFGINLNVASCQERVLIDNFRFGGNLVARTIFHSPGSERLNITTNNLFSFENGADWTSPQAALGGNTGQKTHGARSLVVPAGNWIEVKSRRFATSETPGATSKLNLDVFIPSPQPNQHWVGNVQAYLECPSAGLYNAYIGQKPLTNLFENEFNSLVFDLPGNVVNTLRGSFSDCSMKLALNVNAGSAVFLFDKLGFVSP